MRAPIPSLVLCAALLMSACSTPQRRISKSQKAFDSFPPEVQAKIKDGRADVGMTPEQVRMALGRPDRVYTRKTPQASQEVWAYSGGGGPAVGVGFGMFSGGGADVFGTSVGVNSADEYPDDRIRVVFENDQVVNLETRER